MLPIWLDLHARKAAVFGGGAVGRRKANYLAGEAEVKVISKKFVDGFLPQVQLVEGEINEHLVHTIGWADLVIAATNDRDLNDAIAAEAAVQGKYCNRADGVSTFLIPSLVERDNYKVAISTEGRSPGMSKYLRLELDRFLGRISTSCVLAGGAAGGRQTQHTFSDGEGEEALAGARGP